VLVAVALLAVAAFVYGLVKQKWALAGPALFVVLAAALVLYLFPRMYGPFELRGRRLRFRGILLPPDDATQQQLPPGQSAPEAPTPPPAPPETPEPNGDQSA
jgi:hypothetical protein